MSFTKADVVYIFTILNALTDFEDSGLSELLSEEEWRKVDQLIDMNDLDETISKAILQEELHLLLVKSGIRSSTMSEYIN